MSNNINNNLKIPVITYSNANLYRFIIYKENYNKSGVYVWNNLITNKSYVGSSINLTNRFRNYYCLNFFLKHY